MAPWGIGDDIAKYLDEGIAAGKRSGENLTNRLTDAEDAARGVDDTAESAARAGDGSMDPSDVTWKQLWANEVANQGSKVAEQGRGALRTAGLVGLGGGGLYVAGQYGNKQENRKAYEELMDRIEAIRNNSNLTPAEKQRRIQQAREAYRAAITGGSGGNGGPGLMTVVTYGVGAILAIYALKLAGVV